MNVNPVFLEGLILAGIFSPSSPCFNVLTLVVRSQSTNRMRSCRHHTASATLGRFPNRPRRGPARTIYCQILLMQMISVAMAWIQVLRRLDWQNMLLDEYSNLEAMAKRKSAAQLKGGLDRRLRRRRRILSR